MTLAGLEPAIPWFVVRCLIRWATGPPQRFNSLIAIKDEQLLCVAYYTFLSLVTIMRFHGVMVSTQDSESCDPSSNLGGTCTNLLNYEKRCKNNFKNEAPERFELAISCLLDRRFNQLSHGAAHGAVTRGWGHSPLSSSSDWAATLAGQSGHSS